MRAETISTEHKQNIEQREFKLWSWLNRRADTHILLVLGLARARLSALEK